MGVILQPDSPEARLAALDARVRVLEGAARGATLNQVLGYDDSYLGAGGPAGASWTPQGLAATVTVPDSGSVLVLCHSTVGFSLTGNNEIELHQGAVYSGANTRTTPYDPLGVFSDGLPVAICRMDMTLGANAYDGYLPFGNSELITGLTPGETTFDLAFYNRTGGNYETPSGTFMSILVIPQ